MNRTLTPAEILENDRETASSQMHVSFPATVESYDAVKRTVDVRPGIPRTYYDENGEKQVEELPVIPSVHVAWLRCGKFRVEFPLEAGDTVLVVCADRDPSAWFELGGQPDPGDEGLHGLQGAIAIPGVFTVADETSAVTTLTLGKTGTCEISIGDEIKLGLGASDYVALASKVDQGFSGLINWLTSHVHPTSLGPTSPSTPPPSPVASVAATKVKAQ